MKYNISPVGDSALSISFGNAIDPLINDQVLYAAQLIADAGYKSIIELIPAYCTLTVVYSPEISDCEYLEMMINMLLRNVKDVPKAKGRQVTIPVCYGGDYGPDMKNVADHTRLSPDEIISLHSSVSYRVYMLGFLAGFPYLGGLDKRLATPRLAKPRLSIEAGSVGIAGMQTGVYSISSPGGWQLIGRTPLKLYDPTSDKPSLLAAGDMIHFQPITSSEFQELSSASDIAAAAYGDTATANASCSKTLTADSGTAEVIK